MILGPILVLLCAASNAPATLPWAGPAFSGDPAAMLRAARDLPAPADPGVDVLLEEEIVSFDASGGRVGTYRLVFRPLTEAKAHDWGVLQIGWNPWRMERPELRARVIVGDGEVYLLDPATIEDSAAASSDEAVFRDDRVVRAPLPALKAGALVEETVVYREREAAPGAGFMARIYLGRASAVRQTLIALDAPAALPLRARVIGSDARLTERVAEGRRRLELRLGQLPGVKRPEEMLPDDFAPWAHLSYSTGRSWREVAAAYAALAGPQLAAAAPLWPEVAALVAKQAARPEIVRAATAAMHRMTRYTGIEFGDGTIVPRAPAQTLQRRYGDCKDLSTLLTAELRAAGVPAEIVLLRAGGEDAEADLPGLHAFNHAIVRVRGEPEIWIDPTAPAYAPGLLPPADQGRLALPIGSPPSDPVRTPVLPAADNVEREDREVTLAELGPARVRVTLESTGVLDAERRDLLLGLDEAKRREVYSRFAKGAYGSPELAAFSLTDPADFGRPVRVQFEAGEAASFATEVDGAELQLPRAPVFRRLPDALRAAPVENEPRQPDRVHDLALPEPHRMELRYRIVLPPGFVVREMPESKTEQLGPATLRQQFGRDSSGAVTAEYNLDVTRRRWTAAEVNAYRSAVDALLNGAAVLRLDQRGKALIAAGKVREGLQEFRSLAALHPKEALHHRQLATALIAAGAGDEARAEARTAVELEPNALTSHTVAAYVLEHDLLGRHLRKGFDQAGAAAELRRARELDPKNYYVRSQLAQLYERSPSGLQFGPGAKLDDAIAEYQSIRRDLDRHDADENLLGALWQAGRFEEVRKLAREMKPSADRDARLVGAAAVLGGVQAALDEAARLAPAGRKPALLAAGRALVAVGRTGPAADLMEQGSDGADPKVRAVLGALRKMDSARPPAPPSDPRFMIGEMIHVMFAETIDAALVRSLYSRHEREIDEKGGSRSQLLETFMRERTQLPRLGLPGGVEALTLALMEVNVDGDDKHGFRVRVRAPAASMEDETYYMVPEGGRVKMVCTRFCPGQLGAVAMERLDAGDLEGAQRWLDWAREMISPPRDAEDPNLFSAFRAGWPAEGKRGPEEARLAASILVALREASGPARTVLTHAMEAARVPRERGTLAYAVAFLLSHGDALGDALQATERVARDLPDAQNTSFLRLQLLQREGRWADAAREAKARLQGHPKDWYALHTAANAAAGTGDFDAAAAFLRKQIEVAPSRESQVLNDMAWHDLSRGRVTDATVANAQRASTLTNDKDYAILNTLAAVDAAAGKTAEARQLFRKTIESRNEDELAEADWLVAGLLAEADGLPKTALAAYARIPPKTPDTPTSVWAIAQRHRQALQAAK